MGYKDIAGTSYCFDEQLDAPLSELRERVAKMRESGSLSDVALRHLSKFFRIKNIYHSNAIEGNTLNVGETRLVVEQGLTITGKPLKDTLEAKNLDHALDYFEELAKRSHGAIGEADIRNVQGLILSEIDEHNAGRYRRGDVEISGSAYKPPSFGDVPQAMQEYAVWLATVSAAGVKQNFDPIVLAAAAHTWFVTIHPFVDGNGRTARLLMNIVLMRYGYPIAIITREDRERYYDALEESQHGGDLTPFISLVQECVTESLEEWQHAVDEQRQQEEWARSIVSVMGKHEEERARVEYQIWQSAMDLLKSYFRQSAELLDEQVSQRGVGRVYFKDFGTLEFEKYLGLRGRSSVKRTWFFRLDFRSGERAARYLFFFGSVSPQMRHLAGDRAVTLHIAHEATPYFYERLDATYETNVPDLCELAYDAPREHFIGRMRNGRERSGRIEPLGRQFIEQVVKREF